MDNKNQLNILSKKSKFFTSDSRKMGPDGIFVALKGEKQDGHSFVADMLLKPKGAFIVSREFANSHPNESQDERILVCDSTHEAHRYLAAQFRKKFNGPVIGVGGSSGKTSTKDFLAQILETHFRVYKTQKSQNGELGIPKTLEGLHSDVDVAVIEIGIDSPGDMKRHVDLVSPTHALLTSIGEEHLNLLKSVDLVFQEEKILFEDTWSRGGMCFAPKADAYLAQLKHSLLRHCPSHPNLIDPSFETALDHPYLLQNAALAASCALFLGVPKNKVAEALGNLSIPEGRGAVQWKNETTAIIADYYNSNPSSLGAAIENARILSERKKLPMVFILGDMLDLGQESEALHVKKLKEIAGLKAELFLVGPEMMKASKKVNSLQIKESFLGAADAENFFKGHKIVDAVVLVKASRGIGLEGVFKILKTS